MKKNVRGFIVKVKENLYRSILQKNIAKITSLEDLTRLLHYAANHKDISETALYFWHAKGGTPKDFLQLASMFPNMKEFIFPFVMTKSATPLLYTEILLIFPFKQQEILYMIERLSLGDLILEKEFASTRLPEVNSLISRLIEEKIRNDSSRMWVTQCARGTVN